MQNKPKYTQAAWSLPKFKHCGHAQFLHKILSKFVYSVSSEPAD